MPDEQDWSRLAEAVRSQRSRMLKSRKQIAALGGPSDFTLARIERGDPGPYRDKSLRQLEQVFGWKNGLVERILAGPVDDAEIHPPEQPELEMQRVADFIRFNDQVSLVNLVAYMIDRLQKDDDLQRVPRRRLDPELRAAVEALDVARLHLQRQPSTGH